MRTFKYEKKQSFHYHNLGCAISAEKMNTLKGTHDLRNAQIDAEENMHLILSKLIRVSLNVPL